MPYPLPTLYIIDLIYRVNYVPLGPFLRLNTHLATFCESHLLMVLPDAAQRRERGNKKAEGTPLLSRFLLTRFLCRKKLRMLKGVPYRGATIDAAANAIAKAPRGSYGEARQ